MLHHSEETSKVLVVKYRPSCHLRRVVSDDTVCKGLGGKTVYDIFRTPEFLRARTWWEYIESFTRHYICLLI